MTDSKKLSVRIHGIEVGILEEKNGKMRFKYNTETKYQLSLSLPVREEVYNERECRGYFGGLLPENLSIRKILAKKYKISENNDFALLKAIGRECAGAVSFWEVDEPFKVEIYDEIKFTTLTKNGLEAYIKELPTKPYLGRRMSLAGAQEKTSVCLINDKVALPIEDTPTTHILKPETKFKQSVQNEYICMKTAKAMGLNVANVDIRKANETEFLLIERFDRFCGDLRGKEAIMRLHQEDFAQASGVWAENKYQFSVKDCLKIIEQLNSPASEKLKIVSIIVFNFLIGNCDAHAKNFSLFIIDANRYLTPFYDLLCTSIYDLDNDMAMKIGDSKYTKETTLKDWKILANDLDISPKIVLQELQKQLELLPIELEKIVKEVNAEIGYEISDFVNQNIANVKNKIPTF